MIKSIRISNFQSHKNTSISFDKGINAIIGTSHHGKSAIIRAILKCVNNRPQGDSFISHFIAKGESMKIEIDFPEGKVIRERGKSFDGYIIGEEKYTALRTNVPEQVSNITKIFPVNFQKQKDQFFLLDKSPGEVGKYFNNVVGLDEMNIILKKVNEETKNSVLIFKNKQNEIEEIKEKINKNKWIVNAKTDLDKIQKYHVSRLKLKEKTNEVNSKLFYLKKVKNEIKEFPEIISCDDMENSLKYQKKLIKEINNLKNTKQEIKSLLDGLFTARSRQKGYDSMPFIETSLKRTIKGIIEYNLKKDQLSSIKTKINKLKRINKIKKGNRGNIGKAEKKLEDFLKETGYCPLCGGVL